MFGVYFMIYWEKYKYKYKYLVFIYLYKYRCICRYIEIVIKLVGVV